jgi:thiamine-phosphate pyrophosphorylase
MKPRLFLVASPETASADIVANAQAACKAGDCASIIVPETILAADIAKLQALGLAVIIRDCEPRLVHRLKADGIHISRSAPVKQLRTTLKTEVIGVFAATSRHIAMEAAESGADYIAFAQKSQTHGEPLLAWWHDVADLPTVAFDPVALDELASLLPQNPDFIRPSDDMWKSPSEAAKIVADLNRHLT